MYMYNDNMYIMYMICTAYTCLHVMHRVHATWGYVSGRLWCIACTLVFRCVRKRVANIGASQTGQPLTDRSGARNRYI